MDISIRKNTCDSEMGEATFDSVAGLIKFDYDREEFAHELINAYRDLFDSNDQMLNHLNCYLDRKDICDLYERQ